LFCLLSTAFTPLVLPVMAKNKADLANIQVSQARGNLEVSFDIQNCFTPNMEEAIRSGVRTTFRIFVVLEKPGFSLLQSKVLDLVLEHSVKFDHLKNEYRVQLPEYPERVRVTKDFEEARRWMSDVKELPVIPLWRLKKDQKYQLSLKAELSKVQLPFFLRYIFFFVSLWDFETDWHKVTFSF